MEKYLSMVTPDDVETQILDWGVFQWLSEPRVTGVDKMVVGIGTVKPGKGHVRHNHPDSQEFIYFLKGKALQTIERPDGLQEKELHAGDLISIPQGAYHSTINVGDENKINLQKTPSQARMSIAKLTKACEASFYYSN